MCKTNKLAWQVIVHRVVSWSARQVGWDLYIHNKSFTLRRERECKRVEIRCRVCHHTRLGFKRETKGVSLGITLGVGQIILGFFLDRLYQIESHGHKKIFEN